MKREYKDRDFGGTAEGVMSDRCKEFKEISPEGRERW